MSIKIGNIEFFLGPNEVGAPDKHLIVGNLAVKILFAPVHNPEMEMMKQMMKGKKMDSTN